jgi:hypothetical protein
MASPATAPPDCLAPVGPGDCALAVGVPLDRADFLERGVHPDVWDFAAKETARHGVTGEFAWGQFVPEAKAMQRLCCEVEAMGSIVRRGATLADFSSLFGRFKVVTLLTHWPLLPLAPGDVLAPGAIAAALRAPSHPIHEALRRSLADRADAAEHAATDGRAGDAESLVRYLGAVVDDANRLYDPHQSAGTPSPRPAVLGRLLRWFSSGRIPPPVPAAAARQGSGGSLPPPRAALERAFPGAIALGHAIEFRDGMHTTPDFLAAIPPGFSGVLQLAVCHSALVGEAVKERCDRCLAVMNRLPTALVFRLVEYKLIIGSLSMTREPYLTAMERVRIRLVSF